MRISCYRCGGSGWVCEDHPDEPAGHGRCQAAGIVCPSCTAAQRAGDLDRASAAPHRRPPPAPRDGRSGQFVPRSTRTSAVVADSFDYQTLWQLLARIGERHRLVRFADLVDGDPDGPFCVLRHDVDYTLYPAHFLAREEAARGIRATYFLLTNSRYYNLLSPSHAHIPAEIANLGHEIGLHYDVRSLDRFPRADWERLLDAQVALLESLCGQPVTTIATHQPGLNPDDPFRETNRYLNAYADRFTTAMPYLSDSCRAWRDDAWRMLTAGPLPDRLQLSLHPINWGEEDRDRIAIFRGLHADLADAVIHECEDLLAKIAAHPAVAEHEARAART